MSRTHTLTLFACSVSLGLVACAGPQPTPIADRPAEEVPDAPPKAPDSKAAPASDDPLAAFSRFVLDASGAVLATAQGKAPEGRWTGPDNSDDLRSEPRARGDIALPLDEGWSHVMTIVELGGVTSTDTDPLSLKIGLVVLADGRVRWYKLRSNEGRNLGVGQETFETLLPEMDGLIRETVRLARDNCKVPPLALSDIDKAKNPLGYPPADMAKEACAALQDTSADWTLGWKEDFVTIVAKDGQSVALESWVEIEDDKVFLRRLSAEPMR